MEKYSFEKGSKFQEKDNFLDINLYFIPGYRWVLEKLYYTPIRPEVIAALSLLAGLISAYYYAKGEYHYSIIGAVFILIKNYVDSLDGHLARAKGQVTRLGRFLDSVCDAIVYIFLFTAIAINLGDSISFLLAYAAMLSAFLQCSAFNYYVVTYKTFLYGEGANRTDERIGKEAIENKKKNFSEIISFSLQLLYQWIYGWQDRIVEAIDSACLRIYRKRVGDASDSFIRSSWYADKKFLTLLSPLCFGTQIFLLAICTATNNIEGYLIFMITGANIYTIALMAFKTLFK